MNPFLSQPSSASTASFVEPESGAIAMAAMPDLLIRFGARAEVVECRVGAAFARLLPVREKSEVALVAEHVDAGFRAGVQRAQSSGELVTIDYARNHEGRISHYEARLAPAGANDVVAFVRDITSRKRAEEELFKSREMLRQVLDTIPQRVFWKDRDSVYLGCSRNMALDCGFSDAAELIGKTDFDTVSKHIAEAYRADDAEVMRTDRARLNFEEPQVRANGTRRWLRTSKAPLHGSNGAVIGVLGSYEDITERMQADTLRAGQTLILEMIVAGGPLEHTLAELSRLMQSLSDGMLCSVMLADAEGKRLRSFVAPGVPPDFVKAVDGIAIAEGMGTCGSAAARLEPVITANTLTDPLWHAFRELAETFSIHACWSAPIVSSQHSVLGTFAMYYRTPRSPSAAERELMAIAAHIAGIAIERKRAEEGLRSAEERYRNIFENALDGIFQIAPEGRVLVANPAFARMFGYETPAQLVDTVRDIARELCAQPERYAEFAHALEARGTVQRWELPMHDREKRVRWVSLDARLARAADGRTLCYEGIARDVTERKRLEQQFLQSQKMEAFGQLAGGVAHDFNNLLTVILGNLSLIRLGGMSGASEQNAIEDCFRSAQRAANLTGQLLTFSRRQPIAPRDLDLNEVVGDMTKLLQRLIGEHIALSTNYGPGGARVRADAGMLEQVLMNLVVNARDAMPGGGRLEIATTAVDLDAAAAWRMASGRPGSFVRLTVRDTGTGIPAQDLPHIFEPFFTTKEVGKGSGLGLATVFGILEQHEGWIDVETAPGRGTAMHVYLPRLVGGAVASPPSAPVGAPRRGSEKILLAEDEADVRMLMTKLLERHGYAVHAAGDGTEALALWQEHRGDFALLVTDMVMPGGLGGRALAAQLLADKPALRVIYCSGYSDDMFGGDDSVRAAGNFLEKPFDVHLFLERVRDALDARR